MLNKKRLAALSLSAVMAASTISIPVNAADFSDGTDVVAQEAEGFSAEAESQSIEVTEDTKDSVKDATPSYTVDGVVFFYNDENYDDYTIIIRKSTAGGQKQYETTTIQKAGGKIVEEAANCEHAQRLKMTISFGENQYFESGWYNVKNGDLKREHNWVKTGNVWSVDNPDHFKPGHVKVEYKCSYDDCGKTKTEIELLDPIEHSWGDWVYIAGQNVVGDDNGYVVWEDEAKKIPKLIDNNRDGYYTKTRYCTVDKAQDTENTKEEVYYAKAIYYAKIVSQKGIATNLVDGQKYTSPSAQLPLDEATIELKDCNVGGSYVIEYYNAENKKVSQKTVEVKAHHYKTFATAVFATKNEADQCTVTYDENGNLVVKNNSCYLPVVYTEVTHCQAKGCKENKHTSKTDFERPNKCNNLPITGTKTKTAAPEGQHIIRTSLKNQINALIKKGDGYVKYSELKKIADSEPAGEDFVQISARKDCATAEKVTISYICVVDKKTVVETVDVTVHPEKHIGLAPVNENEVAATCSAPGHYEAVTYCANCGKEMERRKVDVPRLKHTNETDVLGNGLGVNDVNTDKTAYIAFTGDKVVDIRGENLEKKGIAQNVNFVGEYGSKQHKSEFGVYAYVYTNCANCKDHEVKLIDDIQDKVNITVVDIKKQSESGKAGSITLKATYVKKDKADGVATTEFTVPYFTSIEAYQSRVEEAPINGFQKNEDGKYLYYVDGKFQENVSGLVEYAGRKYLVEKGVLCDSVNGVTLVGNEAFYFFANGVLQSHYTGLAMYDGQSFYLVNGKVDLNVNGLVPYNGGIFVFAAGRLVKEANGLYLDTDGTWYFTALGQVQTQYTGVALYDGEFFYIQNGKLAKDYKGTVNYNGAKFNVVGGQLYGPIK